MRPMFKRLHAYLERFWVWLGGEPPAVEATDVVEPDPNKDLHVVRLRDTLRSIVRRFSASASILADLNGLEEPNQIRVGQRLLVPRPDVPGPVPRREPMSEPPMETEPGPFLYIVQTGDAIDAIAQQFGVAVATILETNRMQAADSVRPGQRLLIPGPEPQPEPVTLPSSESEAAAESSLSAVPVPLPLPEAAPDQSRDLTQAPLPNLDAATPVPQLVPSETGFAPSPGPLVISLPPIPWPDETIRGVYVSYFAIGHEVCRRYIVDMLTKTEINALVIDVKGDRGLISYPTQVAHAQSIGAARPTAHDFEELMDFFKANGVYTIARIVTFRDHPFANAYPHWAVYREGGGLWHDRGELAWADPFVEAVWEYNADLAEEAACRGFDEIQFDYLHFPIPSQEGSPHFSQSIDRRARVAAVTAFLNYIRQRLAPLKVRLAATVVGHACWRDDDSFIGQDIRRMAQYLDVICPMLYPSTFGSGIPGYEQAIRYPYEIVFESMKRAVQKSRPSNCLVRPWIQDFPDYRFDKRVYGPAEIRAQMQGSFDAGGSGYMTWDPDMKYTSTAYLKKTIDMSLTDDYN